MIIDADRVVYLDFYADYDLLILFQSQVWWANGCNAMGLRSRKELYKKAGIDLSTFDEFTILEGYNQGWGKYTGLLLSNTKNYYYHSDATNKLSIHALPVNANTELTVGLSPEIIDMVRKWDTTAILEGAHAFGAGVHDGMELMATKVSYDAQRIRKIETITFREFVP